MEGKGTRLAQGVGQFICLQIALHVCTLEGGLPTASHISIVLWRFFFWPYRAATGHVSESGCCGYSETPRFGQLMIGHSSRLMVDVFPVFRSSGSRAYAGFLKKEC